MRKIWGGVLRVKINLCIDLIGAYINDFEVRFLSLFCGHGSTPLEKESRLPEDGARYTC